MLLKNLKLLLICLIAVLTGIISAIAEEADDKAEFKRLYDEFNDLYANSEEIGPIIEVAEKVYEIAQQTYGENHMNTAVVTYNLASLYDEKGADLRNDDEQRAFLLYDQYFNILDKLDVPIDKTYLEQYIAMVVAIYNANTYKTDEKYAKNAIRIAQNLQIPDVELGNLHYLIGNFRYKNSDVDEAKKLFQQARVLYENVLGSNDYKVAEMLFYIARIDLSKDRHKAADQSFLKVLEILDDKEDENAKAMVQITHSSLVRLYSEIGEVDKATPHCIAYAMKSPDDFKQQNIPLYEVRPKFPGFLKKKGSGAEASVIVEYEVDANGFTIKHSVDDTHDSRIAKAAVEAIKKFRYAPHIKDGIPVGIPSFQMSFAYWVS